MEVGVGSPAVFKIFMKVRSTIKKRCPQCKMVKRGGYLRIICANKPRHKQKQA